MKNESSIGAGLASAPAGARKCNRTRRVLLLLAPLATSLLAQEPAQDPTAHHDQAKAAEARAPIAAPHLSRAMSLLRALGLDERYSFQVIVANTDDTGGSHVRLQQYFQKVKVVNGTLISHMNASGEYLEYTDALKKNVNISVQPAIRRIPRSPCWRARR
jgi:Zn-dependent metalloprotease